MGQGAVTTGGKDRWEAEQVAVWGRAAHLFSAWMWAGSPLARQSSGGTEP